MTPTGILTVEVISFLKIRKVLMRKSLDDKKAELIRELMFARASLLTAVGALPPERLDETFLGTWSAKDLLAHLVGWDFTNLQAIREIQAGLPPTFFQYYDKDWQAYNARLVAQYKIEPTSALLVSVQESHRQLCAFLESLPAGFIVEGKGFSPSGRTITVRNLLRAEARDELKHAEQVRMAFG
jgi:hypothetical protein